MIRVEEDTAVDTVGVFIICLHPLVCEGLRLLLTQDEDVHVAGAAPDAESAKAIISERQPEVVLIVSVAGEPCATAVRALKSEFPDLTLLVLSQDTRPEQIQAALLAGIIGYLPLTIHPDELIGAILTANRNELTLHPDIVPPLLTYLSRQSQDDKVPDLNALSPRQQEVLSCLVRGLGDRDIAQELFISVRTVQTHLAHIYDRLGVSSRTEAAVLAVRGEWFNQNDKNQ